MREIDLTQQDIRCFDEPEECDGLLNFAWECWFDVDAYFGVEIAKDDNSWINFYTYYNRDEDKITATYEIDRPDTIEEHRWELTKDEELFLRKLMEEYVGCDLRTYYDREFR